MIIELFGPPGAGKTTFARALAARLQEHGYFAELKLSYRPTERPPVLERCQKTAERYRDVVIHRLSRPLAEMLTIARHPFANSRDVQTAVHLVRMLPPGNVFASIKNIQYITRLSHHWYREVQGTHLSVFDQAFVQAVCSLALLAGVAADPLLIGALDYAPKSDVLIRLHAPLEILRARLFRRMCDQGAIEHLLEPDLQTSLASNRTIDRLHDLLLRLGRPVLSASSLDDRSLWESVDSIEAEIVSKFEHQMQKSSSTVVTAEATDLHHQGGQDG
jgi:RecA/RadA recombinase